MSDNFTHQELLCPPFFFVYWFSVTESFFILDHNASLYYVHLSVCRCPVSIAVDLTIYLWTLGLMYFFFGAACMSNAYFVNLISHV